MTAMPPADHVRDQYEAFPYPARDPRDEDKRLIVGSPSYVPEIEHYIFGGRLPLKRKFRALVAGGGTGDGCIMLAQLLHERGIDAEVTYLDLSTASRAIAEARAHRRNLTNITFLTGPIESLTQLAPGPYDYIDCCGVLHHMEDPSAGTKILAENLSPEGGMGIMLYGKLGRTGVYPMQAMLRQLAQNASPAEALPWAKRLLKQLPPTNWLLRNPALGDFRSPHDADLYDLLLHRRDRAYDVEEIFALMAAADLVPVAFVQPWRYDPASYLNDPKILSALQQMDWRQRCGFAENLAGNLKAHIFYAVPRARAATCVADPDQPDMVPVWYDASDQEILTNGRPLEKITIEQDGVTVRFPLPSRALPILKQMDGKRNFDQIADAVAQAIGQAGAREKLRAEAINLYRLLNRLHKMGLRHFPAA